MHIFLHIPYFCVPTWGVRVKPTDASSSSRRVVDYLLPLLLVIRSRIGMRQAAASRPPDSIIKLPPTTAAAAAAANEILLPWILIGSQRMPSQSQNNNQGLVLSAADAKPRLKWTRQLHERFVDAVAQLGGADKATPKSVMRIMGVPGLTLYHLKSHLQKYRLAKSREPVAHHGIRKQESEMGDYRTIKDGIALSNEMSTEPRSNEAILQVQMQVQKKLQEQLEVQRHLQLRIEAQGKYLQSVLRKAQETLAGYTSNCMGMEAARAELSELVSAVETECLSSSPAAARSFAHDRAQHADCSTDSCLTSSEKPEAKDARPHKLESSSSSHNWGEASDEISPDCCRETRSHGEASEKQASAGRDEESREEPVELDLNT